MFALIYASLTIAFISAVLAVSVNGNIRHEAIQVSIKDSLVRGIVGLESAYRGYKKANEGWLPPDEANKEPQTYEQLVPTYGFPPAIPLQAQGISGTWSFTPAQDGARPYVCLTVSPDASFQLDALHKGALEAGAVFSVSPTCNTQVLDAYPSSFPATVTVTYYL